MKLSPISISKYLASAFLAFSLLAPARLCAADMPVKHEMRSAWVATVWRLDWPTSVITSTGNSSQIAKQKSDLTTMLDSMAVNNMNAVNFQVRSRADAFYKSSYEPWSSDLVSKRGMDPGYDPLEFCVAECHKRGLECHAWINPYRFESQIGQWSGLPGDYRSEHPDWIQDVGGASILEPANPEVRKRICDIVREIVRNYDVDGVLFDDYFYLQGVSDQDARWYADYQAAGGTLSLADWRRENVNMMIADVYNTIKAEKPWVRFGVSPAGIACTSKDHAAKYGVSPCPVSSDWQYNGIYSDPLAWISNHNLDFISPQIYWTIGSNTDYDAAAKWWSGIADKWDRHFFSSHSISSLTSSSKAPGMVFASGPNASTFEEYANQIRLNREYTPNNAPGSIFYSVKYMYKNAPKFAHYLKSTVFNTHALVPAMPWFAVTSSGIVDKVEQDGGQLNWTGGPDNVRYTVYAVPASLDKANFSRQCEYLAGISYTRSFTIPQEFATGYNFAVCIYDRYGNEYGPVFASTGNHSLQAPVLTSPSDGQTIEMPFDFKWSPVDGATHYIIELAEEPTMSTLLSSREVSGTSFASYLFNNLTLDKKLYWRVRSCGTNAYEGISDVQSFVARNLTVDYPADGATGIELSPEIRWGGDSRDVVVEIATSQDMAEENIVYRANASQGRHRVADFKLGAYTSYFVRLSYEHNGTAWTTPVSSFTTAEYTPDVPAISYPAQNGTLYSDGIISVNAVHGLKNFRVEVSASESFPGRQSYSNVNYPYNGWDNEDTGADIRILSKNLVDGQTYYTRVRGQYATPAGVVNTQYSPAVKFTYSSAVGAVDEIETDSNDPTLSFADNILTVKYSGNALLIVCDMTGATVMTLCDGIIDAPASFDLSQLPAGVYIASLNGAHNIKVIKK